MVREVAWNRVIWSSGNRVIENLVIGDLQLGVKKRPDSSTSPRLRLRLRSEWLIHTPCNSFRAPVF